MINLHEILVVIETSKFVPVTHYDVSVTSRLAKNDKSAAIFCFNILN